MLAKLFPREQADTVYDIDLDRLWNAGIRGIITDLDNTLVGAGVALATPELHDWLARVSQQGFKLVIVSNNHHARVSSFAEPLKLPFIWRAKKPTMAAFKRALAMMELGPQQAAMVGDQLLTDVFGGNRIGLYTILVKPIAIDEEGFFTRINRRIEKKVRRMANKR
ncbi:YqeG family HAD IIIA-type phosphatase [Paenibacillus cymbidii]|uniref:YqeG family HAD IIIA-type phosphatase n=1 Tax=Paenibacillus cymbidii TaxID=1639034 RepID=UPI001A9AE8E7|nr:YqeG family HAD IIIA-type phosphatase [Paenibacillus cymbidii]